MAVLALWDLYPGWFPSIKRQVREGGRRRWQEEWMGQDAVGPGVPTVSVRRGKRPTGWEGLTVWLPLETPNGPLSPFPLLGVIRANPRQCLSLFPLLAGLTGPGPCASESCLSETGQKYQASPGQG